MDDLPVLGEECRRILRITAAFNSAVYDFEKAVIRKVVRQRQPLEPLPELMEKRLAEIHQQESAGLLILDKLSDHGENCLIHRQ